MTALYYRLGLGFGFRELRSDARHYNREEYDMDLISVRYFSLLGPNLTTPDMNCYVLGNGSYCSGLISYLGFLYYLSYLMLTY